MEQELTTEHTLSAPATEPAPAEAANPKGRALIRRTIFLIVGLIIMSFGVALSIRASLGTSPVSSVPYVLNLISGLSVGTTTILVNVSIVLLQILLLRRAFPLIQLLQVPVCIAFGLLTDLALLCMTGLAPTTYFGQWLACFGGIVLVAVGVSFEIAADVVTMAGEGLALALCKLFPRAKFGTMKVVVDCSLVLIAVILSLCFLHGLYAVREGTVAAAVFVGLLVRLFIRWIRPLAEGFFGWPTKRS